MPDLNATGVVTIPGLGAMTERHRLSLDIPATVPTPDVIAEVGRRTELHDVVFAMDRGWVGAAHLRHAAKALRQGRRVWFFWPHEQAIERVDADRLRTLWRLWAAVKFFLVGRTAVTLKRVGVDIARSQIAGSASQDARVRISRPSRHLELEACKDELLATARDARPASVPPDRWMDGGRRIAGAGVYLRTDYWNAITSGGSYGHTCFVARELAATSDEFIACMANRYPMLDDFRLSQIVLPKPPWDVNDVDLPLATHHYYPLLRVALEATRPSYIYERLVLGNFVGARLSLDLGIPYILEYNGSEISMRRSFEGTSYENEPILSLAEEVAFKQATVISVVSDALRDGLIARGVDQRKILVNPNGADTDVYAPPSPACRAQLRAELQFGDADTVIGFSGTFGGWHGIDVLAAAIPRICERRPNAKVLLIGDGSRKPALDAALASHDLGSRVRSVGRVPQAEGARLLGACDLFVSPHNSHMVDSRFFGSPTKLFEYMAMGRGVIGSDLEQLGEVLSPALRVGDFAAGVPAVTNQRAVLCAPGDVDEFVAAVVALIDHPEVADALGRNARQAVIDQFSWRCHVARLWAFLQNMDLSVPQPASAFNPLRTEDAYKDEVQKQWNSNPVGTHYTRESAPRTLEWFKEIESFRYGTYGPWMPELMEFDRHRGEDVLEIGGGVGTDLVQFARHGARVTDVDLSAGHLDHARQNFELRGLQGRFVHHDAETLPFEDNSFDLVYSNGVLHHTPNTERIVSEIRRVLRPGGRAIIMVYAEHSLYYWSQQVWKYGLRQNLLGRYSIGEVMSRRVEKTLNDARPLVKVYTARRLRRLFESFESREIYKRQLEAGDVPAALKFLPLTVTERLIGWNLIIKATKPRR
jgi:glycosyltransferase involved in cell wall biosynthesis/ubiquinone/menaquinone biosynthesis C-methylase UbiE